MKPSNWAIPRLERKVWWGEGGVKPPKLSGPSRSKEKSKMVEKQVDFISQSAEQGL